MTYRRTAPPIALFLSWLAAVASTAESAASGDPLAPFGWYKDLPGIAGWGLPRWQDERYAVLLPAIQSVPFAAASS